MVRTLQTAELAVEILEGYGLEGSFKSVCENVPCSGRFRVRRGDNFVEEQHLEIARHMHSVAASVKDLLQTVFSITVTFAGLTIRHKSGRQCSVDLLAKFGGDFCWFELKWTRRPLTSPGLGSLEASEKIKAFSEIQQCLRDWTRIEEQGGGPVYPAQRLGKLLVNPSGFRLVWQQGGELCHNFDAQPAVQRSVRTRPSNWSAWNETEKASGNARKRAYKETEDSADSVAASSATRRNFDPTRTHRTRSRVAESFPDGLPRPRLLKAITHGCFIVASLNRSGFGLSWWDRVQVPDTL